MKCQDLFSLKKKNKKIKLLNVVCSKFCLVLSGLKGLSCIVKKLLCPNTLGKYDNFSRLMGERAFKYMTGPICTVSIFMYLKTPFHLVWPTILDTIIYLKALHAG